MLRIEFLILENNVLILKDVLFKIINGILILENQVSIFENDIVKLESNS